MADPCEIEECVDKSAVTRHGCWKLFFLLGVIAAFAILSQLGGCSLLPGGDDADSGVITGEMDGGDAETDGAVAEEGEGVEPAEGEENADSSETDGAEGEADGDGAASTEGDADAAEGTEGDAADTEGEGDTTDAAADGGDGAAAAVAPTLAIAAGAAAGSVDLSGTAAPNSDVEIVVDGTVVGTATTDADGNWQYTAEMAEGDHNVLARATGADGSALESAMQPYTAPADEGDAAEGEATEGEGEGDANAEGDAAGEGDADAGEGEGEGDAPAATDNIPTVATNAGTFNTLLAAAGVAGLTETLASDGPFTVFAPTDEAFAALPDGTIDALLANPDALTALLLHHVVAGQVASADLADGATLESAGGTTLTFAGGTSSPTTFDVGNAGIAAVDIAASNGLIHVVDSVILPPAEIAPPVIDVYGVPTFEGTFLTVVGLGEPNTQLLLEIDGEEFGRTTVTPEGTWLVEGDITSGERVIIAYTVTDAGLPIAVSNVVNLIVK